MTEVGGIQYNPVSSSSAEGKLFWNDSLEIWCPSSRDNMSHQKRSNLCEVITSADGLKGSVNCRNL